MTSNVDIANRMLSAVGTRSTIASLTEDSNEAIQCNLLMLPLRDQLLRMAPWNCATNYLTMALLKSAPGTPENTDPAPAVWNKTLPPPPWCYEYAYPSDCLRPLWIVPQFVAGFSGVPITTALTGGPITYQSGPPVKYQVIIDQDEDTNDIRVIVTNQAQAILRYIKRVENPDVMDENFVEAWVAAGAARLAIPLSGDKDLAKLNLGVANQRIMEARATDGNENLTIIDTTPDWIRTRGIYSVGSGGSPSFGFEWGPLLNYFG